MERRIRKWKQEEIEKVVI